MTGIVLHRGDDFGDAVEPRLAAEAHLRRPAVDRHRADAQLFEPWCQVRRDDARVVPAEAQLARQRHVAQRRLDPLDHLQRRVRIAQQLAAAVALGDLVDRAAHVDVDDVRPAILRPARRFAQPVDVRRRKAASPAANPSQVAASSIERLFSRSTPSGQSRSVHASPTPPHERATSRNARSQYPAIGASSRFVASWSDPIFIFCNQN